jgi:hypothetical protein
MVTSLAGRESTFTRTWRATDGYIDAGQVADLTAWLERTVLDSMLTRGVQLRLA